MRVDSPATFLKQRIDEMSLSVELQRLKEMEYTLHIRDVSWNGFLLTAEGKALKRAVNDQRKLVQKLQEEA